MSASRQKLLERAQVGQRESAVLEFKRLFDISSAESWCEVIKDICAMANSGGGVLVFGVEDGGQHNGSGHEALLALDPSEITNRIAKYTGVQFAEFELLEVSRQSNTCAAMIVGEADVPIVFIKPGTYEVAPGKQKTAFSQGTVYFRHGAKSEPGNRDDLAKWRDRSLDRIREQWLSGVRKVVAAPSDHVVTVHPVTAVMTLDHGTPVRISSDSDAPGFVPLNAAEIWPHRRINLIAEVNRRLDGNGKITGHDVQCINRKYDVLSSRPEFAYKPHPKASPQYSDAYAKWIAEQIAGDPNFLKASREAYHST